MEKPIKVAVNEDNGAIKFFWENDRPEYEHIESWNYEDFDVKGSIVMPKGRFKGYCMIAGRKIRDGVVWIFEQTEWKKVGNNEYDIDAGIWSFLNMGWNKYFCKTYYCLETPDFLRYYRQILRESLVIRKPSLPFVSYAMDDDNIDNLIIEYTDLKMVRIELASELYKQLQILQVSEPEELNAVQCFRNLLDGFERKRWMPKVVDFPQIASAF